MLLVNKKTKIFFFLTDFFFNKGVVKVETLPAGALEEESTVFDDGGEEFCIVMSKRGRKEQKAAQLSKQNAIESTGDQPIKSTLPSTSVESDEQQGTEVKDRKENFLELNFFCVSRKLRVILIRLVQHVLEMVNLFHHVLIVNHLLQQLVNNIIKLIKCIIMIKTIIIMIKINIMIMIHLIIITEIIINLINNNNKQQQHVVNHNVLNNFKK
jgi:hypothetical protein